MAESSRVYMNQELEKHQERAFLRWVNGVLSDVGLQVTTELAFAFSDGLLFIALLEALSGHHLPPANKNCKLRIQRLSNISLCLEFLEQQEIKLVNIRESDLEEGKKKVVLALIWTLILHYEVPDSDFFAGNPRVQLLAWVNDQLETARTEAASQWGLVVQEPVTDMDSCWSDGMVLCALVDSIPPHVLPADSVSGEAAEDVQRALELAETYFGVPQIVGVNEIIRPVSERPLMAYLSLLKKGLARALKDGVMNGDALSVLSTSTQPKQQHPSSSSSSSFGGHQNGDVILLNEEDQSSHKEDKKGEGKEKGKEKEDDEAFTKQMLDQVWGGLAAKSYPSGDDVRVKVSEKGLLYKVNKRSFQVPFASVSFINIGKRDFEDAVVEERCLRIIHGREELYVEFASEDDAFAFIFVFLYHLRRLGLGSLELQRVCFEPRTPFVLDANEPSINKERRLWEHGQIFTRYPSDDTVPVTVGVFLHPRGEIYWHGKGKFEEHQGQWGAFPLHSVTHLYYGKQTQGFDSDCGFDAEEPLSFSLAFSGSSFTLDVEADTKQTRDTWLDSFIFLRSFEDRPYLVQTCYKIFPGVVDEERGLFIPRHFNFKHPLDTVDWASEPPVRGWTTGREFALTVRNIHFAHRPVACAFVRKIKNDAEKEKEKDKEEDWHYIGQTEWIGWENSSKKLDWRFKRKFLLPKHIDAKEYEVKIAVHHLTEMPESGTYLQSATRGKGETGGGVQLGTATHYVEGFAIIPASALLQSAARPRVLLDFTNYTAQEKVVPYIFIKSRVDVLNDLKNGARDQYVPGDGATLTLAQTGMPSELFQAHATRQIHPTINPAAAPASSPSSSSSSSFSDSDPTSTSTSTTSTWANFAPVPSTAANVNDGKAEARSGVAGAIEGEEEEGEAKKAGSLIIGGACNAVLGMDYSSIPSTGVEWRVSTIRYKLLEAIQREDFLTAAALKRERDALLVHCAQRAITVPDPTVNAAEMIAPASQPPTRRSQKLNNNSTVRNAISPARSLRLMGQSLEARTRRALAYLDSLRLSGQRSASPAPTQPKASSSSSSSSSAPALVGSSSSSASASASPSSASAPALVSPSPILAPAPLGRDPPTNLNLAAMSATAAAGPRTHRTGSNAEDGEKPGLSRPQSAKAVSGKEDGEKPKLSRPQSTGKGDGERPALSRPQSGKGTGTAQESPSMHTLRRLVDRFKQSAAPSSPPDLNRPPSDQDLITRPRQEDQDQE